MNEPEDIRTWSKQTAVMRLFRAELVYLEARGWIAFCGTRDNRYMLKPGDDPKSPDTQLYTHEEALAIQKEADK